MESNLIYNITFCNPDYGVRDPCQEKTSSDTSLYKFLEPDAKRGSIL